MTTSAPALQAVQDIPGAPRGAYWDGGIADYHLHLNYGAMAANEQSAGLVLSPHFQRQRVPGCLDKALRRRHAATPFLDKVVLLAPNPAWIAGLDRQPAVRRAAGSLRLPTLR